MGTAIELFVPDPPAPSLRETLTTRWERLHSQVMMTVTAWQLRRDVAHDKRMIARDAKLAHKREAAARREFERMDKRQASLLRRELYRAKRAISERLTRLEFAHWRINQKRYKISRLRFAQAAATPAALYLRVDTVRMPRGRGITTDALSDGGVLHELSLACGSPVSTYRHYANGFWFVIERAGGLGAIPNYVEFDEVFRQMPDSAGPLDIPLGVGVNKRFHHVDITAMPHLLIAGATGFGKSVFLHNLICTVIQRAQPRRVRMVLVDLKGGTGMGGYAGIPHLWDERTQREEEGDDADIEYQQTKFAISPRIYDRREDVIQVLKRIFYECERRFQVFQRAGVRDLPGYNRRHTHSPMPYLLCIFDEIQNIMLDNKNRAAAERLLTDIASRSRAAGIHLVVSTQRPSVDVITGLIKANFPARLSFATATPIDSRVILNNGNASELGRKGLCIYQNEMRQVKCQSAFVSESYSMDVVERVRTGAPAKVYTAVGKLDMLRWAITENAGKFDVDAVHSNFAPRGVKYQDVRDALRELGSADVELDGTMYRWRQRDKRFIQLDEFGQYVDGVRFQDVATWAVEYNEGKLDVRSAYSRFKGQISERKMRKLLASVADDTVITLGSQPYRVQPAQRKNRPRKVVPA